MDVYETSLNVYYIIVHKCKVKQNDNNIVTLFCTYILIIFLSCTFVGTMLTLFCGWKFLCSEVALAVLIVGGEEVIQGQILQRTAGS